MCDEHDGVATLVQIGQSGHDDVPGLGVQVAGGLIGEDQRRVVDECPRDSDPLSLASGQLVGEVSPVRLFEAGSAQDLGCPLLPLLPRNA